MSIVFSSKARTLESLNGYIKTALVPVGVYFTVREWRDDQEASLNEIEKKLGDGPFIVRSSSKREDGYISSNAGAFLSVPKVDLREIPEAVNNVIISYGEECLDDEVLIQRMLRNVYRSGVAFTHDPQTCSPYRIINWSDSADTASITGGASGRLWQQAASSKFQAPDEVKSVIELLNELTDIFDGQPVDCEFAFTEENHKNDLWILQARPLILSHPPESDQEQALRLEFIHRKVERGMQPHPFLKGKRTVYGVMPDWNPAEIIGIRPRPLSLSIYRDLVTDSIWAYQRNNYGYRNLRSFPLMPNFFGLPYIDVRLSFNSFIPADVDDVIADRLADYYIDKLMAKPSLHDKVEFEIVFSCYTLDLPTRLECLKDNGFTSEEVKVFANSLRQLTNRVIDPKDGLLHSDARKLKNLSLRRKKLMQSCSDPIEQIHWLLEDTKRYGTLPFAGIARAGFIAVQMLRSLVEVGIFSENNYEDFFKSMNTVTSQLAIDRANCDKTTFLRRYGHLRPGTYDITSPRYDESPDMYFDWNVNPEVPKSNEPFSLTLEQMREIGEILNLHGLNPDAISLLSFMKEAIELRELSKFQFTRNVSKAISLMKEYGNIFNIMPEDLSYCDLQSFKDIHMSAIDPKEALMKSIAQGKSSYSQTLKTSLPPLISSPKDVWGFEWKKTSPNFITNKKITAPVTLCDTDKKLNGLIVCIPNADPGFDWLFSCKIAGLITAWGGANSHMAIRAGELGLPSVIGAGEFLYCKWSSASLLYIDCAGHRVDVIK